MSLVNHHPRRAGRLRPVPAPRAAVRAERRTKASGSSRSTTSDEVDAAARRRRCSIASSCACASSATDTRFASARERRARLLGQLLHRRRRLLGRCCRARALRRPDSRLQWLGWAAWCSRSRSLGAALIARAWSTCRCAPDRGRARIGRGGAPAALPRGAARDPRASSRRSTTWRGPGTASSASAP